MFYEIIPTERGQISQGHTVGPRITPPHIALLCYCTILQMIQNVSHHNNFFRNRK